MDEPFTLNKIACTCIILTFFCYFLSCLLDFNNITVAALATDPFPSSFKFGHSRTDLKIKADLSEHPVNSIKISNRN